ncbi:unnamed protein product [Cunninghamella blakesleeana]
MDPYLQAAVARNRNYFPTTTKPLSVPTSYPPSEQPCENTIHTPEGILKLHKEWVLPVIIPKFFIACHISIGYIKSNTSIKYSSNITDNSLENSVLPNSLILEESLNDQHNNNNNNHSSNSNRFHHNKNINLSLSHSTSTAQSSSPSFKESYMNNHPFHFINIKKSSSTTTTSSSYLPSSTLSNVELYHHDTRTTIDSNINNNNPSTEEYIPSLASATASSSSASFSSLFNGNWRQQHHYHHRRPKNNMSKLKSSLIENVQVNDKLSKILANRILEDPFLFFNKGACFLWVDHQTKDYLTCITFSKTFPTCHDINKATLSSDRVDLVIGFSTGDCIWYDPLCNRYTRFNKHGILNNSKVTSIKWVPNSEDLFIVSFENGVMLTMDKEREDQQYILQPTQKLNIQRITVNKPHKQNKYNPVSHWQIHHTSITDFKFSNYGTLIAIVGSDGLLRIIDFIDEILIDIFSGYYGKLLCVTWSPDDKYLLTGGQDDLVTIWSYMEHRIVSRCQGHKSWVTGVAFDDQKCNGDEYRFASVGEDCKLILWDFSTKTLHKPRKFKHSASILNSVMETSKKGYNQLSTSMLQQQYNEDNKNDNHSDDVDGGNKSKQSDEDEDEDDDNGIIIKRLHKNNLKLSNHQLNKPLHLRKDISSQTPNLPNIHPLMDKTHVPFLQPLVIRAIHTDACIDILFTHDNHIFTSDRKGCIKHWCK